MHRDLGRIHGWLGNRGAILRALRRDPLPVGRVLDVGCGAGSMLAAVRRSLGTEVIGVDLRRPPKSPPGVKIIEADAVRAPLPECDVAISLCLAHHLSEQDVIALVRNVGRSARRFVLLDLVRHALPLNLFRALRPVLSPITFADGLISVRRAFTARELGELASEALAGTSYRIAHAVAPLYTRQILDIRY
jgi:SAM-dependent methyltransferase